LLTGWSAGIWLACVAMHFDKGNWLALHVLEAAWAAVGAVALLTMPRQRIVHLLVFGALVVVFAVQGADADPLRPYAPALAGLAVAGVAGGLALVEQDEWAVWASALLVDLAGGLVWWAWGPAGGPGLASANVAALTGAAALWSLLDRRLSERLRAAVAVGG